MLLRSRLVVAVTGLIGLAGLWNAVARTAAEHVIGRYELVSEKRISRTVFEYTYRASLTNSGPALASATASVTTSSAFVTITDASLAFGPVASGQSRRSTDTFAFRLSRVGSFKLSELQWTITPVPENRAPVAAIAPIGSIFVGVPVPLSGAPSSDPDGNPLSFAWTLLSRPAASDAAIDPVSGEETSFVPDRPGTYELRLTVSDGALSSSTTVNLTTTNRPPVADAGAGQTVTLGAAVTLDGTGSTDPDGDALTYGWSFVSLPAGSSASLSDAAAAMPTFTADRRGNYRIRLVVTDAAGTPGAADEVVISTENTLPVANAGPDQTVANGALVTLDGSASSDADGDSLTFAWVIESRPAGSAAVLSDATAVMPTFVADRRGVFTIRLTVTEPTGGTSTDVVAVTTSNTLPVADAGPDQTLPVTTTVSLDGSGSGDVDSDPLTFQWSLISRPAASAAALSSASAVRPTFVLDQPGQYIAQLIVNDGTGNSAPDTVVIDTVNSRPVADAGDDASITVGAVVSLSGEGSFDIDGDSLTYAWSFTSRPAGSLAALSDAALPSPSFIADVAGTYVVQLIVSDGVLTSVPDTVTLTTANTAPSADAGPDQTVTTGTVVQLDGAGSTDAEGDDLTYVWSFTSRPAGSAAALSNPGVAAPTFVADVAGTYVVQLIVGDGVVNSAPDTVSIVAVPPNAAPTGAADSFEAGQETPLAVAAPGVLANDTDADNDPLTAILATAPSHGQVALAADGSFTYTPEPGFFGADSFEYRASDGSQQSAVVLVTIQVRQKPAPPVITAPISAGATAVAGTGAQPGASVQLFVNGLSRGAAVLALGNGSWIVAGLTPALVAGDAVTARQTVGGLQSDASLQVLVTGGGSSSAVVGPGGGTLQLPDGARLVVPAGALTAPVTISVTETPVPAGTALPPSGVMVGKMYTFEPAGLTFNQPVMMTLPYDPGLLPAGYDEGSIAIHRLAPGPKLHMVGSATDDPEPESPHQDVATGANTVTLFSASFSSYGAVAVNSASEFTPDIDSVPTATITFLRPSVGDLRTERPNAHNCAGGVTAQGTLATRAPGDIKAIVVHSTNSGASGFSFNGELGWATDDCNKFFAHYYLDRTGGIYQVADDTTVALHTASSAFGISNANAIGIELFNNVGEPYDGRMVASLIRLLDYLSEKYAIPRASRDGTGLLTRNVSDIGTGGDRIITHSEHQPANKKDPIGTFQSSQNKIFMTAINDPFPLHTAAVTGGGAGPSLMDIVVDAVGVLDRDRNDTGVINTSGGDSFGLANGGLGGDVTWREDSTAVAARVGAGISSAHNDNSLLVVAAGATRTDLTGQQSFTDAIIAGTVEVADALDLRVKGTVYIAPTGRIIVRNGLDGRNLTISTRGVPLIQGLVETAALDAPVALAGPAGGHVQIFAGSPGPFLIPTIITRGGDADSADPTLNLGNGGAGGAVTITVGDSPVFVGGGVGEAAGPPVRANADPARVPPDHVGDHLPLPPPFNLGSIGLVRPVVGQRVPLRKAAFQPGFLRGILTSGGMGGTGVGGTAAQQAGGTGGAGGSFTLNTDAFGTITFRDVDLITGADVEMVVSDIFVPEGDTAFQMQFFAATGGLGGRGTLGTPSGGAGGRGGIAGAITVDGTLSPMASSVSVVEGLEGNGEIVGFDNNGRPFTDHDPLGDFVIGASVQATGGGRNLYRLRLDLSGNALGGSGGIPSGRASGFPGAFGPRGAGSPILGLPK